MFRMRGRVSWGGGVGYPRGVGYLEGDTLSHDACDVATPTKVKNGNSLIYLSDMVYLVKMLIMKRKELNSKRLSMTCDPQDLLDCALRLSENYNTKIIQSLPHPPAHHLSFI